MTCDCSAAATIAPRLPRDCPRLHASARDCTRLRRADLQLFQQQGGQQKFSSTDADIIFAKSIAKGKRKMGFEEYRYTALPLVAQRAGMPLPEVIAQLSAAGGPQFTGTVAASVRHHDDRSLYSGVHGRGGPSTHNEQITLETLMDRSPSDYRGRMMGSANH